MELPDNGLGGKNPFTVLDNQEGWASGVTFTFITSDFTRETLVPRDAIDCFH